MGANTSNLYLHLDTRNGVEYVVNQYEITHSNHEYQKNYLNIQHTIQYLNSDGTNFELHFSKAMGKIYMFLYRATNVNDVVETLESYVSKIRPYEPLVLGFKTKDGSSAYYSYRYITYLYKSTGLPQEEKYASSKLYQLLVYENQEVNKTLTFKIGNKKNENIGYILGNKRWLPFGIYEKYKRFSYIPSIDPEFYGSPYGPWIFYSYNLLTEISKHPSGIHDMFLFDFSEKKFYILHIYCTYQKNFPLLVEFVEDFDKSKFLVRKDQEGFYWVVEEFTKEEKSNLEAKLDKIQTSLDIPIFVLYNNTNTPEYSKKIITVTKEYPEQRYGYTIYKHQPVHPKSSIVLYNTKLFNVIKNESIVPSDRLDNVQHKPYKHIETFSLDKDPTFHLLINFNIIKKDESYYFRRMDKSGTNWKQIDTNTTRLSEEDTRDALRKIDYQYRQSIIMLLQVTASQYYVGFIDNTERDIHKYTKTSNIILVEFLTSLGDFKCIYHYFYDYEKLAKVIDKVVGLRLFHNNIEIKLYSKYDVKDENREYMFYNPVKKRLFVFMDKHDESLLLICYDDKAYRPMNTKSHNWVRLIGITECISKSDKLISELNKIHRELYPDQYEQIPVASLDLPSSVKLDIKKDETLSSVTLVLPPSEAPKLDTPPSKYPVDKVPHPQIPVPKVPQPEVSHPKILEPDVSEPTVLSPTITDHGPPKQEETPFEVEKRPLPTPTEPVIVRRKPPKPTVDPSLPKKESAYEPPTTKIEKVVTSKEIILDEKSGKGNEYDFSKLFLWYRIKPHKTLKLSEVKFCKNKTCEKKLQIKCTGLYSTAAILYVDVFFNRFENKTPILFILFFIESLNLEPRFYCMSKFDHDSKEPLLIYSLVHYTSKESILNDLARENEYLNGILTFDLGKTNIINSLYNNDKIKLSETRKSPVSGFTMYTHTPTSGSTQYGCVKYENNVLIDDHKKELIQIQGQNFINLKSYFSDRARFFRDTNNLKGTHVPFPLMAEIYTEYKTTYFNPYYCHYKNAKGVLYWEQLSDSNFIKYTGITFPGQIITLLTKNNNSLLIETLKKIEFMLFNTIVLLIERRDGNYSKEEVRRALNNTSPLMIPYPTCSHDQPDPLKLTENKSCTKLKEKNYHVFDHTVIIPSGRSVNEGEIVELRILIPTNKNKYGEICLYNNSDDTTSLMNREYLMYTKSKGTSTNILYTYFYGEDPRPLLLCFDNRAYRAINRENYLHKWIKIKGIHKCPCGGPDVIPELLKYLTEIVYYGNTVKLEEVTEKGQSSKVYITDTFYTSKGPINIEITVTAQDLNCYRKYSHTAKHNFALGEICYNNYKLFSSYEEYKKMTSHSYTFPNKVSVYYYMYDRWHRYPLMILLEFNSKEEKQYYKLTTKGSSKAWSRIKDSGKRPEDLDKVFLDTVKRLESEMSLLLGNKHELEKKQAELQSALENMLYLTRVGLEIEYKKTEESLIIQSSSKCYEDSTNWGAVGGGTAGGLVSVGAVSTGVLLAKFPEWLIPVLKALT